MDKRNLKVLFVCSGNSKSFDNIAPFIRNQGESLKSFGVDVQYFPIYGKGITGYLKAAFNLRRYLKESPIDIIHAHYTLSGWSALLSFPQKPIVLSLMGADAYGEYIDVNRIKFSSRYLIFLTYLIQPFVKKIICKSRNIESFVYLKKKSHVIPNGILLEKINYHKHGFKNELGLEQDKKHVLFLGSKKNRRKNIKLAEAAVNLIDSDDISLVAPHPIPHEKVIKYLNSVDVTIVPSLMEGSPNVVKEAMACNCPVVATDVGDIAWLFGNEPGHFLTSFEPEDSAEKIKLALQFIKAKGKTNGRQRIVEMGLDADSIAKRVISVYQSVIQ
jgi:teichuronic acid biosynthesis glycosyltransferase TuaC